MPDRARESAREEEGGGRGRGRRRGRRRGRGRSGADAEGGAEPRDDEASESGDDEPDDRPRFEEFTLFDLEDGSDDGADAEAGGRRRRGRGGRRRRRGGRGGSSGGDGGDRGRADSGEDGDEGESRSERSGRPSARTDDDEEEDTYAADDFEEALSELPDELEAETTESERPVARTTRSTSGDEEIDEDEEDGEEEPVAEVAGRTLGSGLARAAVAEPEAPKPPRRRAVIVARADRDSLLSAVVLARDIRLLEGLWVYPQQELMGFFREVAVDLRDDVPIYVVGFAPSPAIDVLQAASLYRERISWFDHHPWAPEDDVALKQALGEASVHHTPGAGSSLPAVLETCTRRSRFTDKLVDLATGRFTQHDYERWGRLWWWRLGQLAEEKRGDARGDVSPLLTGRPSDLAKEAARAETPPVPEEVTYVSSRDFRLVHFVGYALVVVDVEPGYDVHLVGRIARERYAAQLSLVRPADGEFFVFAGEELAGRRVLDFAALVDHLANKLDWVTALPNDDHVARFRIVGLAAHPERLDEVIGEIAMGRSILER